MFNFSLETKKDDNIDFSLTYDFIALGAGPAGLNAALYASRKGFKTLIVGHDIGGQLLNTTDVDNYLGLGLIDAEDMIEKFLSHVKKFDIPMLSDVYIKSIKKTGDVFQVSLNNGQMLKALTVLYALGGSPRKLGVEGEEAFSGRGVSYCVTCDAPFYKNKHVVISGGGNSAVDAAIDLTRIAKKVTVIHRSQFRADQKSVEKLMKMPNVEVFLETQILSIHGDTNLTHLTIIDKKTNEERSFETDGIFIEIGTIPNSTLLEGLVDLNGSKEIIVDSYQRTNVAGFYAAGDVTENPHKQIVIAAAEGAKAALEAAVYLNKRGD